jgi:hypothetical protein
VRERERERKETEKSERDKDKREREREREGEISVWRAKIVFFCIQGRNTNYIPAETKGFW